LKPKISLHAFASKSCLLVPSGAVTNDDSESEDNSTDARQHSRKYDKKREKDFLWVEYDENYQGAFCKVCQKSVPILGLKPQRWCMGN